jgi:hypothetical protein
MLKWPPLIKMEPPNLMEDKIKYPYSAETEIWMQMFYASLNEKDRRHYAAIEAHKLGHGGITYISELLNCARSTVHDAIEEFKKKSPS